MAGDLIAFAAKVGDELTVEAEFHMDGIEIIEAFQPKTKRPLPETLEILGSGRDQPLVTTQLAPNRRSRDRDRDSGDRRGRQDRRDRGDRRDRDRRESHRDDDRPKAKRLRPARTHRQALIDSLPEEQKPVAEKMMRDGVASVEQALRDQRKKARDVAQAKKKAAKEASEAEAKPEEVPESEAEAKPEDAPESEAEAKPEDAPESEAKTKPARGAGKEKKADSEPADEFLTAARKLLPQMRSAEWRDRVEAALAEIDDIDLRDLRSVVVAAEDGATDDEAKALAEELRNKLTERVDREHAEWLAEVAATLADGRMVRALRLSSRPPKAGVPLPQDMVNRLTEAASAALASDTPSKRWITVLGAVAFSPVRRTVQPQGIPENPDKELLAEVTKLSERVPHIAALFGVEPTPPPRRGRRGSGAQAAGRR
jgi:hypothetical protein